MAKILVVDDDAANMTLAVFLLESAGHTVLRATRAEAGIALARDEHPDLILMDIQLPGIDGLEAVSLLKSDVATRAIPVIALTALAMKGDEQRLRAGGCDGYIGKPTHYKEFLATVATQLAVAAKRPRVVLIVDDERDNRALLEIILKQNGLITVTAANGKEALACVARQRPDLILLDVMMPEMNGFEVTTELKRADATKDIPIVILTALYDATTKALALKVGADDLLTKPLGVEEICACVYKHLRIGDQPGI